MPTRTECMYCTVTLTCRTQYKLLYLKLVTHRNLHPLDPSMDFIFTQNQHDENKRYHIPDLAQDYRSPLRCWPYMMTFQLDIICLSFAAGSQYSSIIWQKGRIHIHRQCQRKGRFSWLLSDFDLFPCSWITFPRVKQYSHFACLDTLNLE